MLSTAEDDQPVYHEPVFATSAAADIKDNQHHQQMLMMQGAAGERAATGGEDMDPTNVAEVPEGMMMGPLEDGEKLEGQMHQPTLQLIRKGRKRYV